MGTWPDSGAQPKQFPCRTRALFLEMDKTAGELDQALEEIAVRAVAILKPQRLQDVVCLVKFLLIETAKVPSKVGIVRTCFHTFQQRRNLVILAAHQRSLAGKNSAMRSS